MPEGVAGKPAGVVAVADAADDAHPGEAGLVALFRVGVDGRDRGDAAAVW